MFNSGTGSDAVAAVVVVGVFVELEVAEHDAGLTGGVDDPNLEGIEIDERDDVDETGDGTAVALDNPLWTLLGTVFVLEVGASKFDIVGECFLFVDPPFAPGACVAGADAIDCLEFGDDTEVDVLVHVVGILLAADAAADDDFPLGIVTAVAGC